MEGGEKVRHYADDDSRSLQDLVSEERRRTTGTAAQYEANYARNVVYAKRMRAVNPTTTRSTRRCGDGAWWRREARAARTRAGRQPGGQAGVCAGALLVLCQQCAV